jgi:hypothetical protein
MFVYAVVDDALSAGFSLGDSLDVFIRREDAERFVEETATILSLRATCGARSGSWRQAVGTQLTAATAVNEMVPLAGS